MDFCCCWRNNLTCNPWFWLLYWPSGAKAFRWVHLCPQHPRSCPRQHRWPDAVLDQRPVCLCGELRPILSMEMLVWKCIFSMQGHKGDKEEQTCFSQSELYNILNSTSLLKSHFNHFDFLAPSQVPRNHCKWKSKHTAKHWQEILNIRSR